MTDIPKKKPRKAAKRATPASKRKAANARKIAGLLPKKTAAKKATKKPTAKRARNARRKPSAAKSKPKTFTIDDLPPSLDPKKMGRPSAYDPIFCELVVELGSTGLSRVQIGASLGVCRQTIANWEEKHPEFLDAMCKSRDFAQAWWENAGQRGLFMPQFQGAPYSFQMKNRFPHDYKDKHEFSGDPDAPMITHVERIVVRPDAR